MSVAMEALAPVSSLPRALSKFLGFGALLASFVVHHSLIVLLVRHRGARHRLFLRSLPRYARIAQRILGLRVLEREITHRPEGALVVANHLSYLDVLALAPLYPALFVTSVEIKETPGLGLVTKLAGCFFVERRRARITAGTKQREVAQMQLELGRGHNVLLFPEGTSSDGAGVLPFKATFFQLATDLALPVIPVCLRYRGSSRATAPWYGDMTFVPHLFSVCRQEEITLTLEELPPVSGRDKFELAAECHRRILEAYART